ncbi:MAG: ABC transporter permease [Gemmatimonadales bacterium]|nr:ABC transporter permease [Gemmatimonadales bacterium]
MSHRELLLQLTLRDIRVRYKQAVMGVAWAILMPMLIVTAGVVVRLALSRAGGGVTLNDVAGTALKAVPWSFFVGSIGFAVVSLSGNMNLVGKVYFPREVLPLSSMLAQCFDSAISLGVVSVLLVVTGSVSLTGLVWLPFLLLGIVTFTAAMCLLLSCANLFLRDVKYLVQIMLTFGIFFTPVFFDAGMGGPKFATLLMLNPLAPFLEGLRLAVIEGHNLLSPIATVAASGVETIIWQPWYLVYGFGAAAVLLTASAVLFHRLEFLFAEYL